MNSKILGLLAVGLLAGPMSAHAVASSCGLDADDNIVCDLYESGGTTLLIDLGGAFVTPGTVGIFETGLPGVFRNVLEFVDTDRRLGAQFLLRQPAGRSVHSPNRTHGRPDDLGAKSEHLPDSPRLPRRAGARFARAAGPRPRRPRRLASPQVELNRTFLPDEKPGPAPGFLFLDDQSSMIGGLRRLNNAGSQP